ncbi:hypothetical protein B0J14DRAFT_603064 [Halenospora varia]|nr:hypothetical protein B0J14DRAFT_603064 [Halenospora varia]
MPLLRDSTGYSPAARLLTSGSRESSSRPVRTRPPSVMRISPVKSLDYPSSLLRGDSTASASPVSIPMPETQNPADISSIPRSRPITIDPHRQRQSGSANTPPEVLTARDKLSGRRFPCYEDIHLLSETHPIHPNLTSDSRASSAGTEPGPFVTYHSEAVTHPPLSDVSLSMPAGKYNPLVYKYKSSPNESNCTTLFSVSLTDEPLDIRQKSEAREKLQQYQSDLVQAIPRAGHMRIDRRKLLSPRLSPLRIPEPVTPIELDESEAYVVARETEEMIGARVRDSGVDDEWPLEPTFEEDG